MPDVVVNEDVVRGKQLKEVVYLVYYELMLKQREMGIKIENDYATNAANVAIVYNEVKHRMVRRVLIMEDPT